VRRSLFRLFATLLLFSALLASACNPSTVNADEREPLTPSFEPRGTLRMELLGGGEHADIEDESNLPDGSQVVFFTRAQGGDYLYLLQRSNGGVEVLHPSTGQVFMNREREQRVVPHRPTGGDIEEESPAGFSGAGNGSFEYILVASPVPRDFPSNSQVETLERLLAPPPYVSGYAALPAKVLATIKVTWGAPDP
jgi:hypothetical protein